MIRIFLTYVLPLALPTIAFLVWASWVRKKIARETEQTGQNFEDFEIKAPWFRLILAGLGLMMIGLLLSALFAPKNPPNSTYQAPYLQDGKVVPGQFAPK